MNTPKAIVIAAGLAAGAVLLTATGTTQERETRYQLSASGAGVWRVEAETGRMVWCQAISVPTKGGVAVVRGGVEQRRVECFDRNGRIDDRMF